MELPNASGSGAGGRFVMPSGRKRSQRDFEDDGDEDDDEEDEPVDDDDDDEEAADAAAGKAGKAAANATGFKKQEKALLDEALAAQEEAEPPPDDDNNGGVKLMAFSLKAEQEEGSFDEEGAYTERTEQADTRDAWLDDFKERNGGRFAQESAKQAVVPVAELQDATEGELLEARRAVAAALQPGESVAAALGRLRGSKAEFDALTEHADAITSSGDYDIYTASKEELEEQLEAADAKAGGAAAVAEEVWEYKMAEDSEEIFGPFPASQMQVWADQQIFEANPIYARRVDEEMPERFRHSSRIPAYVEVDMFA